jgi:hypothetical protein
MSDDSSTWVLYMGPTMIKRNPGVTEDMFSMCIMIRPYEEELRIRAFTLCVC